MNDIQKLGKIYESMKNQKNLFAMVKDTMGWLLEIEDFDEAEDSCNMELDPIGGGRESVVYHENGVIVKLNTREKQEWLPYIKLPCFCHTEIYDAPFGLVILQEELTLDASEFWENDVESAIIACMDQSGLPYDRREITDENVGLNDLGEWKLFDIPIE